MQSVTYYNSSYNDSAKLKPIKHLQCTLRLHEESINLLHSSNLLDAKTDKLPPLVCIMDEMPEIGYSTEWGDSSTKLVLSPIDLLMDSGVGKFITMFAEDNFISIPHTNEFSQQAMKNGGRIELQLKFRIYADSYNDRIRMHTSTYETWLKTLYFATTPLVPSTYDNYISNTLVAVGNSINEIANVVPKLQNTGSAAINVLDGIFDDATNLKTDAKELLSNLKDIVNKILELQNRSYVFGHVTYDIEIPGYINATAKTANKVYWIVKSFTAKPCAQFLRGLYDHKATKITNTDLIYRPKPLYFDFTVRLETNQIVSKEQLLTLLVDRSAYNIAK